MSLYATPEEDKNAKMVNSGQTVYYEATAHYTGKNGAPDHLTINWLNLDTGQVTAEPITIWNTPSGIQPQSVK